MERTNCLEKKYDIAVIIESCYLKVNALINIGNMIDSGNMANIEECKLNFNKLCDNLIREIKSYSLDNLMPLINILENIEYEIWEEDYNEI